MNPEITSRRWRAHMEGGGACLLAQCTQRPAQQGAVALRGGRRACTPGWPWSVQGKTGAQAPGTPQILRSNAHMLARALLPRAGRVLMLRIAELVPKHPGRHKKPGQKADGAGSSADAGGGSKQQGGNSKKKGKKK